MERRQLDEELFGLLSDLIAIPSTYPPGDTSRIAAYCADVLSSSGYETRRLARKPGVENVVATRGSEASSIVFSAHADTVDVGDRASWGSDPYQATLRDGRVYGLGAANCKASMAVHLWLARQIARRGGPQRGTVQFTFVGDEENLGPEGLSWLREAGHIKPASLIVGAPTRNKLVLEERGVMWLRITTRGRAAHAGAPETGESAVMRTIELVRGLGHSLPERRSKSGHRTTLSVGRIRGGDNINVVPDQCVIELDRRILPDDDFDAAFREIRSVCEKAGASAVELLAGTPGFSVPEDGRAVTAFAEAIRAVTERAAERLNAVGASDARYFARDSIDLVVTGPGDGVDSHVSNEFVALDEVVESARIHLAAAERLFGL
jgi:acetylornithine deacetylase/succinyl-diaminopimelate desuccinylase family protein